MKFREVLLALCFLLLCHQYWIDDRNSTFSWKIFHRLFLLLCPLILFGPGWPSFWMSFILSVIRIFLILILSRLCPSIVYILHFTLMLFPIVHRNLRRWHIGGPLWIYQLSLRWILALPWLLLHKVHLLKLIISSFLFHPPASLLNFSVLFDGPKELSLVWFNFLTPRGLYLFQPTSQRSHWSVNLG